MSDALTTLREKVERLGGFDPDDTLEMKPHGLLVWRDEVMALLSSLPPSPEPGTCGAIGYPEAGRQVCVKPDGHKGGRDDYHRSVSGVEWLGYHRAPKEPQP